MRRILGFYVVLFCISCNSSDHTNNKAEGIGQSADFTKEANVAKNEEDCDTKSKEEVKKELEELENKQKKGLGLNPQGGCTLDELK